MKVKDVLFEDFVNYKKPSMTIMMPKCDFKCDRECGLDVCQNSALAKESDIDVNIDSIIDRYISNYITESVVFQGLEPFDTYDELYAFIYKFTEKSHDDIVIYTGYNEDEVEDKVKDIKGIIDDNTLIIKFGRFIPNREKRFDEVLGITLASDNQYGKVIE